MTLTDLILKNFKNVALIATPIVTGIAAGYAFNKLGITEYLAETKYFFELGPESTNVLITKTSLNILAGVYAAVGSFKILEKYLK